MHNIRQIWLPTMSGDLSALSTDLCEIGANYTKDEEFLRILHTFYLTL